jgi:hypothetical protein
MSVARNGRTRVLLPLALACLVLMPAGPAEAQITVTVVMKTGERHVGENPQLDEGGQFSLRRKSAGELRAKKTDVAHVEFAKTTQPPPKMTGPLQGVVTRNGEIIKGAIVDMAHLMHDDESSEYVVRLRDETGTVRRLTAAEISRVYF